MNLGTWPESIQPAHNRVDTKDREEIRPGIYRLYLRMGSDRSAFVHDCNSTIETG
jgi:hypothetical protein